MRVSRRTGRSGAQSNSQSVAQKWLVYSHTSRAKNSSAVMSDVRIRYWTRDICHLLSFCGCISAFSLSINAYFYTVTGLSLREGKISNNHSRNYVIKAISSLHDDLNTFGDVSKNQNKNWIELCFLFFAFWVINEENKLLAKILN